MKWDIRFLRSKVAWRIFTLFICCALVPILALGVFSYRNVSNQLEAQNIRRLQQATKNYGMAIFERLLFLETVLDQMTLSRVPAVQAEGSQGPAHALDPAHRFEAAAFFNTPEDGIAISGHLDSFPKLTQDQLAALEKGQPVIAVQFLKPKPAHLWLAIPTETAKHRAAYGIGQIDIAYLMGIGSNNTLPPMTELCVLDQNGNRIVSSIDLSDSSIGTEQFNHISGVGSRHFEFKVHGVDYVASYWPLFIQSRFFSSNWTIILAQSKDDLLAPVAQFKEMFPLVILMSIWIVLLLSIITIRKSLVPLERLKEGTRRLANRDFATPVVVSSRDEFQDLADSFNTMATEIDRQFKTLTTIAEIDRAILSSLDPRDIVSRLLERIHELLPCTVAIIGMIDDNPSEMALHFRDVHGKQGPCGILETDYLRPLEASAHLMVDADAEPNHPLLARTLLPIAKFLIVPIRHNTAVRGIIAIGYGQKKNGFQQEISRLSQLSNQVAVAISNAELLRQLDQLNWQTLTALARTVDAKSPWTAGHSERVTQLSLKIGKAMNLSDENLDILHRAALLHDIGKIAVPSAILDKPGRLTEAEYRIIQQHPKTGARILEPVKAYRNVIPIVVQHHECFNGSGYPDGLSGSAIAQGARILSVADVYDALASDRPYRESWPREKVLQIIEKGAGTLFDPEVVQAVMGLSL
jgi:putative nucleotidyltransferase with HDIG domain